MSGLANRLRAAILQLRSAVAPMILRGRTWPDAVFLQLPQAALLRAWRRVAQYINVRMLERDRNVARFLAFQAQIPPSTHPRLLVIVMPWTLHFLIPCLSLVQPRAQVILLMNGAKAWEQAYLSQRFPDMPVFQIPTLPASSAPHGELLSFLLKHHREDFGIVDHDAYVFDSTLLERLKPASGESMVGVFKQHSQRTGLNYPQTHLLYFNVGALRTVMGQWSIDARQFRTAPRQVAPALARLGLGPRSYLKDYHNFFDTLHVLLAVSMSEGLLLRFEEVSSDAPVLHVGGTSIGSHHTKNLVALYIHLRFLELLDDPRISARYAHLVEPLKRSSDALERADLGDPSWHALPDIEDLMTRLNVTPQTPPARQSETLGLQ